MSTDDRRLEALLGEKMGVPYDVDNFYMPLVTPSEVAERGIALHEVMPPSLFDRAAIRTFCEKLGKHARDDLPRHDEIKTLGLGLGYGEPETVIYDAAIRSYDPDLIIEVGCGVSTWYARNATAKRIVCIEPYPGVGFPEWCESNAVELWKKPLQEAITDIPTSGKVLLFIDSTHVAKITSELHLVFTTLLPRLPSGSLIHFHDIFLPWPCLRPTHNSFPQTVNWYESTLLGIYLQASNAYEVLLPQYWMGYDPEAREMLKAAIPLYRETPVEGSSFWFSKR